MDVASHHTTEATAECEPQARAAVLARGGYIGLCELLEQLLHLLRRDADARVADSKLDPLWLAWNTVDVERNGAALCKLAGVA